MLEYELVETQGEYDEAFIQRVAGTTSVLRGNMHSFFNSQLRDKQGSDGTESSTFFGSHIRDQKGTGGSQSPSTLGKSNLMSSKLRIPTLVGNSQEHLRSFQGSLNSEERPTVP